MTQLPQHLPDEVFGLCNNFILHKVDDPNVVSRLKRTVGGIDESLWQRLPNGSVCPTWRLAKPSCLSHAWRARCSPPSILRHANCG